MQGRQENEHDRLSRCSEGIGNRKRPLPSSKRNYCSIIAGSVLVYWIFVSLIPVYNKYFFQKDLFPYPIATAGLQLGCVSILLAVWNTLEHCYYVGSRRDNDTLLTTPTSWIGGPHLIWKLQWCAPIGVLFGLKYGVTNLGLHLVAAPTHLLLQATDLVWTVLSAWIINRERLSMVELGCLAGCIAGSFVLSWHHLHPNSDDEMSKHEYGETNATLAEAAASSELLSHNITGSHSTPYAGVFAIFINLLSPMLLGLCIATLRLACCELMRPDNRVAGKISAVELTTLKLWISSLVALLLANTFERGDASNEGNEVALQPWWQAFLTLPWTTKVGVMGGSVLIAIFQVNCTMLTHLTSAVSVGLVGQGKIIPQWIIATIFATATMKYKIQGYNLLGAFLIMTSAATFAGSKFWMTRGLQQELQQQHTGAVNASFSDSTSGANHEKAGHLPRHGQGAPANIDMLADEHTGLLQRDPYG